jgi:TP901 family phage tail tape measure protein
MAAINIDVGANTRRAEKDIQKLVSRSYNINLKTKGDQPLGRITGKVNEFTKSLDASNARVIAFGASAGIIFGVQRAFEALARSVIDVQKSLTDINVILNVSTSQLQKFGGELFNIAKNTGQSFNAVAQAATEFSRQGLGLEETLKRTNNALILSRLSGLDTVKSVEALTAAVNSFASQAVTATEVVNKFANVDAAFAVSSADLAEALARVGSSAAQSGVSLNELIAIVTSAQQTTARGGAVIGNSFKTIFTRLQRSKVVNLLEGLGVDTKDSSGQIKSTINLLTDLAKVYDNLGTLQQAEVAEKVGGVFQINILKAALADLSKEYSVYNNALNVAASSTDQAIRRNEELNKTYAAQINALQENARQLAANVGDRVLGPSFQRVVGGANSLLGNVNENEGKGIGATLAKGILDGLGQVLAGPGLALIGGIFIKLFKDLTKFASGSLKDLLGLNNASKQQADIQQSISQILAKNPKLIDLALQGEKGLAQAANQLLAGLQKQTIELQKQAQIASQIAKTFYSSGVRVQGGIPVAPVSKRPVKAAGHIPNFASDKIVEKYTAMSLGATPSVRPHMSQGTIGGRKFVMNNQEIEYPGVGANGDSMVIPLYGDGPQMAARGFVPNFIQSTTSKLGIPGMAGRSQKFAKDFIERYLKVPPIDYDIEGGGAPRILAGRIFESKIKGQGFVDLTENFPGPDIPSSHPLGPAEAKLSLAAAIRDKNFYQKSKGRLIVPKTARLEGRDFEKLRNDNVNIIPYPLSHSSLFGTARRMINQNKNKKVNPKLIPIPGKAHGFIPNFAQSSPQKPINLGDTTSSPLLKGKKLSLIHPGITEGFTKNPAIATYLGQQYKGLIPVAGINKNVIKGDIPDLEKNLGNLLVREANQFGQAIGGTNFLQSPDDLPNYGAVKGAVGTAFEGGIVTLLQRSLQKSAQTGGIDFRQKRMTPKMRQLFHRAPGAYEAKYAPEQNLINDVLKKLLTEARVGEVKQVKSGAGFKESQALRAQALKNLQGQNLRRGPQLEKAVKEEMARISRSGGMATGYIPNFAAIQSPLQESIKDELASGVRPNEIGIDTDSRLKAPWNKSGLGVWSTPNESSLSEGIDIAKRSGINPKTKGKKTRASGFIPNFAINNDVTPANITSSVGALITELSLTALLFRGLKILERKMLEDESS